MNNKQFNGIEAIIANDLRGVKAGYHTLEEVEEDYYYGFVSLVEDNVITVSEDGGNIIESIYPITNKKGLMIKTYLVELFTYHLLVVP